MKLRIHSTESRDIVISQTSESGNYDHSVVYSESEFYDLIKLGIELTYPEITSKPITSFCAQPRYGILSEDGRADHVFTTDTPVKSETQKRFDSQVESSPQYNKMKKCIERNYKLKENLPIWKDDFCLSKSNIFSTDLCFADQEDLCGNTWNYNPEYFEFYPIAIGGTLVLNTADKKVNKYKIIKCFKNNSDGISYLVEILTATTPQYPPETLPQSEKE